MIFNGKIIYEWAIFHGHVKLQEDSVGFSVRSPTTAHRQTTVPGFNRLQLPRVEGNLWRNEARKKLFFFIGFHWKLSIYTGKMVVSYKLFCHEHPWVFHGFSHNFAMKIIPRGAWEATHRTRLSRWCRWLDLEAVEDVLHMHHIDSVLSTHTHTYIYIYSWCVHSWSGRIITRLASSQHNHPETPGWVLALSILFWGPMLGNLTTPGWFDIVQLT